MRPAARGGCDTTGLQRCQLSRSRHSPQRCRQQELGGQSLPSYPTQWPRSWGLVGGTLSPRAFLISPGAFSIFRGRPGFWAPASLARGFRVCRVCWARAERELIFGFLSPCCPVCFFSSPFFCSFFPWISFFSGHPWFIFPFQHYGSIVKSGFFSGHGMLSTLDGKSKFWSIITQSSIG